MKMNRPDLVVPYQTQSFRDRVYPYVLTVAIIILTVLAVIYINVEGAC